MDIAPFKIKDKTIGPGHPVFIIAEIGVNHNGDTDLALEMISEAAKAGADCVKFQTFKAERVVIKTAPKANYQLLVTDSSESQLEMLRKLELPSDAYKRIITHCENENVIFMSTPYNIEDVDFLDDLGVDAYKLASIHAAEPYFAKYTASKNKPIILSTGMADVAEITECIAAINEGNNSSLAILQCTTNYPSSLEDANLRSISTMQEVFGINVGYSDHTVGNLSTTAAVALGATIIEKHFTTNKQLEGPDQSTSVSPEEFRGLVQAIRHTELALGSGIKEPTPAEIANMKGMRRSIVAKTDIPVNTEIRTEMLTFKRPNTGIPPAKIDNIIGKRTTRAIQSDSIITWEDISS